MVLMNNAEVKRYLPHRYPFLLVDKVTQIEPGKSLEAIKNVTSNEPYFQGHFPAIPVMPGVLMIEALAQAAGLLIYKTLKVEPEDNKSLFFLAGIDEARYKRVVEPGDQLHLRVEILKTRSDLWIFQSYASVDGQLACSAIIKIMKESKA